MAHLVHDLRECRSFGREIARKRSHAQPEGFRDYLEVSVTLRQEPLDFAFDRSAQ